MVSVYIADIPKLSWRFKSHFSHRFIISEPVGMLPPPLPLLYVKTICLWYVIKLDISYPKCVQVLPTKNRSAILCGFSSLQLSLVENIIVQSQVQSSFLTAFIGSIINTNWDTCHNVIGCMASDCLPVSWFLQRSPSASRRSQSGCNVPSWPSYFKKTVLSRPRYLMKIIGPGHNA